ncbi:uncharacterized protein LOC141909731 isoform X2 [Tubulanus polymorphus]|uniref:uncharacterized protein LOC141909731 isoform X2 n=1 Tax=Tubulanus polymorphus TaxID=672921 RepID=UPI003DA36989
MLTGSRTISPSLQLHAVKTGNKNHRHKKHHRPAFSRGLTEEIANLTEDKGKQIVMPEADGWKESIRQQIEEDIDRRVRAALETPPLERLKRNRERAQERYMKQLETLNSHLQLDLTDKERDYMRHRRYRILHDSRRKDMDDADGFSDTDTPGGATDDAEISSSKFNFLFSSDDRFKSGAAATDAGKDDLNNNNFREGMQGYFRKGEDAMRNFGTLTGHERRELFHIFTRKAFNAALKLGRMSDGSYLQSLPGGKYRDKYGIVRDAHGPFWPHDYGPLYPTPEHKRACLKKLEPLSHSIKDYSNFQTFDTQTTQFTGKWRGVQIVYDCDRSAKDYQPPIVPENCCPSLTFESRFECGNLQQARRVGQFEYELVLKTDLYTKRHTQWFYFRIQNMVPGVTYRFIIINLLKADSLYNHGMRPLFYSEMEAQRNQLGWYRRGHHISYCRNVLRTHCPLLLRDRGIYHQLEWQTDFPQLGDTCYFAHCYPYTYTDMKNDIDSITTDPKRRHVVKREVLCESKAGNSCFLLTVTNFNANDENCGSKKKGVVITARVHPGESNSSWMMKGVLDYLTGNSQTAQALRDRYVFKLVPMLNPDGVIVGNYRCSLAARDLNRNYRHPRKDNFPTIYYTKSMMEELSKQHEIVFYCDLHGHSRKNNVFMYGCDWNYDSPPPPPQPPEPETTSATTATTSATSTSSNKVKSTVNERLFPYLMSKKCPEKFSLKGCRFHIRRCKEATGRVVMFRQMKILNSFTMEATFCGTTSSKGEGGRHFNFQDFQEIGHAFCETILEYEITQGNKEKQLNAIVDITRCMAEQILENQGIIRTQDEPSQLKQGTEPEVKKANISDELTEHLMKFINGQQDNVGGKSSARGGQVPNSTQLALLDYETDRLLMETECLLSGEADDCFQLLERLQISDDMMATESSDSDSESEPELPVESEQRKPAKKHKKKKRKQLSRRNSRCEKIRMDLEKPKEQINTMPPLLPPADPSDKPTQPRRNKKMNQLVPTYPLFISKYEGRKNNGIPCFSHERSIERATRRMHEMRRRMEEAKQRETELYFLQKSQDELRDRLQQANDAGTANVAQTLLGLNYQPTIHSKDDGMRPLVRMSSQLNSDVPNNSISEGESETSDDENLNHEMMLHRRMTTMQTPYTTYSALAHARMDSNVGPLSANQRYGNGVTSIPNVSRLVGLDPIMGKSLGAAQNKNKKDAKFKPVTQDAPTREQYETNSNCGPGPDGSGSASVFSYLQSVSANEPVVLKREDTEFFMINNRLGNQNLTADPSIKDESEVTSSAKDVRSLIKVPRLKRDRKSVGAISDS